MTGSVIICFSETADHSSKHFTSEMLFNTEQAGIDFPMGSDLGGG